MHVFSMYYRLRFLSPQLCALCAVFNSVIPLLVLSAPLCLYL